MANVPADKLRIALVGGGPDATLWRALLDHRSSETEEAEDVVSLQERELDLVLVFTEAVRLADAAREVGRPEGPPAVLLRVDPLRTHPLTALMEALIAAKREWEGSFDALVDPVAVLDAEGAVVRSNVALARAVGLDFHNVVGRNYRDVIGEPLRGLRDPVAASLADGQARTEECRFETLPGVRQVTTSTVPDHRGRLRLIVVLKDVTDMRDQQERMQQSLRLAELGRLAGGMAHEINTPLASIALRAESLLRASRDPELLAIEAFRSFPRHLQAIDEEIFRCKKIINSVLDFSRARVPEVKPADLNEVARSAAELVEANMALKQVRLELDLDPELPPIHADQAQIRQALLVLLTNALDASFPGGVVTIQSRPGADRGAVLTVADQGAGISSADREKIFSPFFTTKPVGRGTGLGLAICHGLVQSHGGELRVESTLGEGARFIIELPARPPRPMSLVAR